MPYCACQRPNMEASGKLAVLSLSSAAATQPVTCPLHNILSLIGLQADLNVKLKKNHKKKCCTLQCSWKPKQGWVVGMQERGWELPQVHLLPDRTTGRTGCRGSSLVCAVLPSSRRAGRLVTERQLRSGSCCVWPIATACKEIHITMVLWYIMFKMIEYMAGHLSICYFWCACHPHGQP